MSKIRKNHMLVQPNILVDAKYNLNKHQINIVMLGLGLLDTTKINVTSDSISFSIEQLYELTGSTMRLRQYIPIIKDALKGITKSSLTLVNPVTKDFKVLPWLSEFRGNLENNEVKLYFNQRLLNLFSEITGNYTQCLLENTMMLRTSYSKRIYQYVMQYKPPESTVPEITLSDLRTMLQLAGTYSSYHELNRRVLTESIKDINAHTDIKLRMLPVKIGKTVNSIQFIYKFKSAKHADVYKTKSKKPVNRDGKKWQQEHLTSVETPQQMNDRFMAENNKVLGK